MKKRCQVPTCDAYPSYGGKGVTVCDRWMKFENFIEDMGLCPPGYSIERVKADGHYEPGNCKWIPLSEQPLNKRNTTKIIWEGVEVPLITVCRKIRFNYGVAYARWKKGWPVERLFITKVFPKVPINGKEHTLTEASKISGVSVPTIRHRILKGWPPNEWTQPASPYPRCNQKRSHILNP